MKKLTKTLLITAAIATAAFAATAQGMGSMHDEHHGAGRMDSSRMEKMVSRHLDSLKAKLKLTPVQETSWTTFTAAMKPSGSMMAKRPDMAELNKLTTPERLDKMREMHKQHSAEREASMVKRDDAIKTFYATLSADQKKVFDAEHARMEGGQHGKRSEGKSAKP